MKKLYLALVTMALAATLATGCGNITAGNTDDATSESRVDLPAPFGSSKAARKESGVRLDDYVTPYSSNDGSTRYKLSLQGYLNDYGVREVQTFNNDDQNIRFGLRFLNDTIVGLSFSRQPEISDDAYELTEVVVTAGKSDYKFTSYDALKNASSSKTKNLARWSRTFDYSKSLRPFSGEYVAKGGSGDRYAPFLLDYKNQAFYFFNSHPLFLPLFFDSEFEHTVVPYLDLDKISLKKDPFKDADF